MPPQLFDFVRPPYEPTEPSPAQIKARNERDERIKWTQEAENATAPLWQRAINKVTDFGAGALEGLTGTSDELYSGKGAKGASARSLGNIAGEVLPGIGDVATGTKAALGGATGVAKAISMIPPDLWGDMTKRLLYKVGLNAKKAGDAYLPRETARLVSRSIEDNPNLYANLGRVRLHNKTDTPQVRSYGGVYHPRLHPAKESSRKAMREDPAIRDVLSDLIKDPTRDSQALPEISLHPKSGSPGYIEIPDIMRHEGSHLAQDVAGKLSPMMKFSGEENIPYYARPHEIGAYTSQSKARDLREGRRFDYFGEMEDYINELANKRGINRTEIDKSVDYLNNLFEQQGRDKRIFVGGPGQRYSIGNKTEINTPEQLEQILNPALTESDLDFGLPNTPLSPQEVDDAFDFGVDDISTTLQSGRYKPRHMSDRIDAEQTFYDGIGGGGPFESNTPKPYSIEGQEGLPPEFNVTRPDPNRFKIAPEDFDIPDVSLVEDAPYGINASGESSASQEAISRNLGMQARGEKFAVKRGNKITPLIGTDAVDYDASKYGGEFGIIGPDGVFRPR